MAGYGVAKLNNEITDRSNPSFQRKPTEISIVHGFGLSSVCDVQSYVTAICAELRIQHGRSSLARRD